MTAPKKKADSGSRAHKASWVALTIAVLTFLTSALGVWQNGPSNHTIAVKARQAAKPAAQDAAINAVKREAARAVAQIANSAPPANQTCSVPVGQGTMGACAPRQPQLVGALARSAPAVIRGKLLGVDTSSYQNCGAPQLGVAFWILKATEGTGYTDRCVRTDLQIAKARRLVYGFYDFMRATGSNAAAEAAHYVQTVKGAGATAGIFVLDVEANNLHLSAATVHSYVCSWVSNVSAQFPGRQIVVYTGNWFWGPNVGGSTCGTVLWDSAYANFAQLPATWGGGTLSPTSRYNPRTPMWQYGDGVYGPAPRLTVNGHAVDSDVFFGTRAQLEQLAGGSRPRPCSKRTACRMGRRHAHVHRTINRKCHGAPGATHRRICLKLRNRNRYMHRYARKHHLVLVTR